MTFHPEELPITVSSDAHEVIYPYVDRLITQAERIFDADPSYTETEIFQIVTRNVVDFLNAECADIWIFDDGWKNLTSFGHQNSLSIGGGAGMPFEDPIVLEVIRTRQSYCISNIWKEARWENKEALGKSGIHSILFVPFAVHRFSGKEVDERGVLRIFYKEQDKTFTPLEIRVAEMFSRRAAYVLARRRIESLQRFHAIKDRIVEHIFCKLARGKGSE